MNIIKKLLTAGVALGAIGAAVLGGTATASASTTDPAGVRESTERPALGGGDGDICLVLLPDGSEVAIPCEDDDVIVPHGDAQE